MPEKESSSDSSYGVENESQAKNEGASTCERGGSCCCSCPFKCPCEALKPENIRGTLNNNIEFVNEAQAMLMFKRPIPMALLIAIVNLCFLLFRILGKNFYAQVTIAAFARLLYKVFSSTIKSFAHNSLFSGEIPKGEGSNRIRSVDEVAAFLDKVLTPFFNFQKIIKKLASDETITGQMIYAGILFFAFALTASIDFFWIIVIIVNAVLILPGVILHPMVREQAQKVAGKAQAAKAETKEKTEVKNEEPGVKKPSDSEEKRE